MKEKDRARLNLWNSSVKAYINANTIISVSEICRRANVHKSDMSRFLNSKQTFGATVLKRIEAALEPLGYKTTDPKIKRLKLLLDQYKSNKPKKANASPFFEQTFFHRDY
jgi:hypothetical protein